MKATAHEDIREDLKAYVDGELRPIRRRQLRRHVSECSDCQKEMEEMKKITQNMFATESASALSDPLRGRLLRSMAEEAGDSDRRPQPIWRRPSSWIYGGTVAVAAASVIVFGVTYMSATQNGPKVASAQMAAASTGISDRSAAPVTAAAPQAKAINERRFAAIARDSTPPAAFSVGSGTAAANGGALAYHGTSPYRSMTMSAASAARAESGAATSLNAPMAATDVFRPSHVAPSRISGASEGSRPALFGEIDPGMGDVQGDVRSRGRQWRPAAPVTAMSSVRAVDNQARLGVEVDDVEAAGDKIADMVKADGGYVATNNLTVQDGNRVDHMTVKVPSKDFDSMIAAFSRYGTVISKNVSGEDITDKTVDANSDEQGQIDSVVETEGKLQSGRMSERRRSALEEQLNDQRSALTQTRSRLGTLRKTAALSTVNLTLTERAKKAADPAPKSGFWSGLSDTNQAAGVAFQSAIKVPVVAAIWMFALSPIWLPLALLVRYLMRKQPNDNRGDR